MLAGLIILFVLCRGRFGLRLDGSALSPDVALIRRLFRVGLPGGADVATVLGCHLWFVSMINGLGTLAAAAHMLAVRIESIAYLPGAAFQVAAATMAGQYLGAGDHDRATRGVRAACSVAIAVMCSAGLLFYFGAEMLTTFFIGDATSPTAIAAMPLLRIAAFAMPAMSLAMVLSGALRGAGDTRWPLFITLIGFLLIRIPGALWLMREPRQLPGISAALPTGVQGAWLASVVDLFVRAILFVWRFRHGGWKRTRV
jgi:Na+-driven multidrug efflux pump